MQRDPEGEPSSQPAPAGEQAFLSHWSDSDFLKLMLHTEARRFRQGDEVIRPGEIDRAMYIILDGKLEVLVAVGDGLQAVAIAEAGLVVGDQAFLDGLPRSALVRAVVDGELLRFSIDSFEDFAAHEPALACSFLFDLGRILSLRLRKMTAERQVAPDNTARLALQRSLPVHRIEIDQEDRCRKVAEILESPFFRELQQKTKQLRHSRGQRSR